MNSSSKQIKIGSIISGITIGINILISLIYTPIMIRLLGNSEYGLYNVVTSTISILSILNLGLGAGYVKFFSVYKSKNDIDSINKLNGLYIISFTVIGIIALICGLFITHNLKIIFNEGLTTSEYLLAKRLMIISTINLAISFPMNVFQIIINANEKFIFLKIVNCVQLLISPFVTIPLLLSGYGSIAIVMVSFILSLLIDFIFIYYVINILKYKLIFNNFEKGLLKKIFIFTSFIALEIIVNKINLNVDKLLLARYMNTFAVAVCSVSYGLYKNYSVFSTAISNLFIPRIHKIANSSKNTKSINQTLQETFIKVGRIQFILLSLILTGFIFFGKEFINFWAGKEYHEAYYVALLLFIPSTIPLIQNIGIEIQRAKNIHKFRSVTYTLIAIANLIISLLLIPKFGVIGAATGTAISLLIGNGIIMNIYYYIKCDIDVILFWKNILGMSKGLLFPILFGCILNKLVLLVSIKTMLLKIFLYIIIYIISAWIFSLNNSEKELFINTINRLKTHG